jgi:hypothetical protein
VLRDTGQAASEQQVCALDHLWDRKGVKQRLDVERATMIMCGNPTDEVKLGKRPWTPGRSTERSSREMGVIALGCLQNHSHGDCQNFKGGLELKTLAPI